MKSLEELKAIRDKMKKQMDLRDSSEDNIRVVVGMATCGIAAGARPVMTAFLDEIDKRGLKNVTVSQTGCIGVCRLEPIVEAVSYTHLGLGVLKNLIIDFRSVTHLHDGHTRPLIVGDLRPGTGEHFQRQHGRARGKIVDAFITHESYSSLNILILLLIF